MDVTGVTLNIVIAVAVEEVKNTEENIVVKVADTEAKEATEAMAAMEAMAAVVATVAMAVVDPG